MSRCRVPRIHEVVKLHACVALFCQSILSRGQRFTGPLIHYLTDASEVLAPAVTPCRLLTPNDQGAQGIWCGGKLDLILQDKVSPKGTQIRLFGLSNLCSHLAVCRAAQTLKFLLQAYFVIPCIGVSWTAQFSFSIIDTHMLLCTLLFRDYSNLL